MSRGTPIYTDSERFKMTPADSDLLLRLATLAGTSKSELVRSLIRACGQQLSQSLQQQQSQNN